MSLSKRAVAAVWLATLPAFALTPSEVLILANKDVPISSQVAAMYQRQRRIPEANLLRIAAGGSRTITREQYLKQIVPPVKQYLGAHPDIRCIVTTSGFPYVIQSTAGKQDGAAVDNELAAVLREPPNDWNGWQPNPLYLRGQNSSGSADPRSFQMVYVTRLDGPDPAIVSRMVEDAIATENAGLEGPVFGDAMGLDGKTGQAAADASLRAAIDRLSGAGFAATLDLKPGDWRQPAGGVGEQAAGAAFYIGWYSLQNFQDIFGKRGLARGAIAWHIASGEAGDLWSPGSKEWCANLLRRGAAVTLGPVFEPYLSAFPKAEIFVESLLAGKTIAESYWLALPNVSWAMVILGDPLYRPFGVKAKPSLVARAYAAVNPSRVLEKGQTSPLLIQLQCIGPAGSGTPGFTAAAEPGMGLAGASGTVTIPPLDAGQTAVIRVPSVTAAGDATGMFRLNLRVQSEREAHRRIVLEGRTGLSLIHGGIDRETQMFVSHRGEFVISGPEHMLLSETATLRTTAVPTVKGWEIGGAAFSPDDAYVVLTMFDPAQKRAAFALADSHLQKFAELPPKTQFLRWLGSGLLLLRKDTRLAEFNLADGTTLPVHEPPGWVVTSIIPETAIQVVTTKDGKFGIRNGAVAPQEVLAGTKTSRDRAVADDLSFFGGIDDEKRLWVQHGLVAAPEILAEHVERITWGPISRRVLIQESGADGKFRIYDGRNRSWISAPPMVAAQWSPDEERLLYLEAERLDTALVPRYLSLMDGRKSERLCDVTRLGEVGAMTFSRSGETAFLLAGADGAFETWMMALPQRK